MQNSSNMISIPLNVGSLPSVDLQANNPRLRNGFVNEKNEIQLLPNVALTQSLSGLRGILKSAYRERFILVTFNEVFYLEYGALIKVGEIIHSFNPIRLEENLQFQVTIVNGTGAWVFSQLTASFAKLSVANGFDIDNPTDVTVLNTFTIITGGSDRKWIVSDANNALVYNANEVIEGDTKVGDLMGVRALNNNLFIFGEGAVQRWVPSIERVPNSFPFTEDPSYRNEFGCISTASLVSDKNEIFYLSENGQVQHMNDEGYRTVTNDGISTIINSYSDINKGFGSYFYWKGYYFYQLTFLDSGTAWLYSSALKKWCESDTLILGFDQEAVLTAGLYQLTNDYTDAFHPIVIQTPYMDFSENNMQARSSINGILLQLTQGKSNLSETQVCDLQISKDNVLYGNHVRRKLAPIAKRLRQLWWFLNYTNTGFSLRFTFRLKDDLTIKKAEYSINIEE